MAKLVLSSGGSVLNNYFIDKPRVVIGRDADNDVVIDDPLVGSQHAAIISVGEDQIIEGIDTAYGTFVNGKRVSRHMLRHRDVIDFGAFSLCYLNSKAAQDAEFDRTMIIAALPRPASEGAGAMPAETAAPAARAVKVQYPVGRIRQLSGTVPGQVSELNRVVSLVGMPGKQLAVITRRPQGFFITHVEGGRHVRLNGMIVGEEPRSLRSGDVIETAAEQFEFQLEERAALSEQPVAESV